MAELVTMTCQQLPGIARLVGRAELKKLRITTWNTFNKLWREK
jgi:hypothetical protein